MATSIQDLVDHYADLRRHLAIELRDPEWAADIAQSSFERVFLQTFGCGNAPRSPSGPIVSMRALLFRVARNLCIDEIRKQRVAATWAREYSADDARSAPSAECLVAQKQVLLRVVDVLERLPARRREVFLLSRAYGYSHSEIAARLGITELTVAKHLVRAALDCARTLAELRSQLIEATLPSHHRSFSGTLAEDGC